MDDFWILVALLSLLVGGAGYFFAKRTGRNPVLWSVLGVMLNVFGMILISFAAASRRKNLGRY
jgi:hypothetical protein